MLGQASADSSARPVTLLSQFLHFVLHDFVCFFLLSVDSARSKDDLVLPVANGKSSVVTRRNTYKLHNTNHRRSVGDFSLLNGNHGLSVAPTSGHNKMQYFHAHSNSDGGVSVLGEFFSNLYNHA